MEGKEYRYTVFFDPAKEGGYIVTVPALPGCVTQGDTLEEAREHAKEAILCHLEALQQEGDAIPLEEASVVEPVKVKLSRV